LFRSCRILSTLCFSSHNTATSDIYTFCLHDALPIFRAHPDILTKQSLQPSHRAAAEWQKVRHASDRSITRDERQQMIQELHVFIDRKSTRLNSSHVKISYAVFCLKKKILTKITNSI